LRDGFDNGPSGMETEMYLPGGSKKKLQDPEEEQQDGCWWKFTHGIQCK